MVERKATSEENDETNGIFEPTNEKYTANGFEKDERIGESEKKCAAN